MSLKNLISTEKTKFSRRDSQNVMWFEVMFALSGNVKT